MGARSDTPHRSVGRDSIISGSVGTSSIRNRSFSRRTALATMGAALLTGCTSYAGANTAPKDHGLLRVGTLPVPDTAPLEIAQRQGMFAAAGLRVELVPTALTGDQKVDLNDGKINVLFDSYPSHFLHYGYDKNVQLVADAFQAAEHTSALIGSAGTKYRQITDLPNAKIAVNDLHGLGVLLTTAVLDSHGIAPGGVEFVEVAFDSMGSALTQNTVNAAWFIEPYITQLEMSSGLRTITSTTTGLTADFPQSGYVCSRSWARRNQDTLKTFVSVLIQAQQLATSRPSAVADVLPSYTGIKPDVATLMAQGSYPTTLSPIRLQRVADLMYHGGQLPAQLNVKNLMP